MQIKKPELNLSSTVWVILIAAAIKFALHLYLAPGYGYFADEFYSIILSRHLALGYVDVPPLTPALVALSQALLGQSLFALRIFPALAGAFTLVFVCLITRELGGKTFAVGLSALIFIFLPLWLMLDSIFCYDSIDQLILAGFLFTLVRFLRSGERKLWIVMGGIAGVACMTKMTIPFLAPGFLLALLISKYRRDLLTPWPWLGGVLCLAILSPYIIWQINNNWLTLEYWQNYSNIRLYKFDFLQFLINIFAYLNPLLLPIWLIGLYRLFRPFKGKNYIFLAVLFIATMGVMFYFRAAARMIGELFIPLIAASSIFLEEIIPERGWFKAIRVTVTTYILAVGLFVVPIALPIMPFQYSKIFSNLAKPVMVSVHESMAGISHESVFLTGRLGWEEMVKAVADVYYGLPPEERAVAGIYADWYTRAGAIDVLGQQYGLPPTVSGSLTYYVWGPQYTWDVMVVVDSKVNSLDMFFEECERKAVVKNDYNKMMLGDPNIYVCRKPKISPEEIWRSIKSFR